MLNNDLWQQIKRNFLFQPTKEQEFAIRSFVSFVESPHALSVFLLKGYAGTGKTTLVSALVNGLLQSGYKCVLLAPTGRAAKVLSHYASQPAYTIHKRIYRQRTFSNDTDNFTLHPNLTKQTLYLVDEASMISNSGFSSFGSGHLFDDLMEYVYGSGEDCRLVLIGDTAQLPPVNEEQSPALEADYLAGYGLEVTECHLTTVVRQEKSSGILYNATLIRQDLFSETTGIHFHPDLNFSDIRIIQGDELIESIQSSYDQAGLDETIVICRSNKRANLFNQGIRNTILYREEELSNGDMLLVAKNNYYWGDKSADMEFIANGDVATVKRVRRTHELYGFRFVDVLLSFPDYQDAELEARILLDTLHTEAPALTREQSEQLFQQVLQDYQEIPTQRERMRKIKQDAFYNALQVKYAYAITCHKAQGGQWKHVYLDKGYIPEDLPVADYYRWLYTAFTRATECLYLVNWKD